MAAMAARQGYQPMSADWETSVKPTRTIRTNRKTWIVVGQARGSSRFKARPQNPTLITRNRIQPRSLSWPNELAIRLEALPSTT